jgi:hypothetical protein
VFLQLDELRHVVKVKVVYSPFEIVSAKVQSLEVHHRIDLVKWIGPVQLIATEVPVDMPIQTFQINVSCCFCLLLL